MYQGILAPLDGSQLGECAIQHVKAIASGCSVPRVILLSVVQPITLPFSEVMTEGAARELSAQIAKLEKEARQKAESYLNKMAETLKKGGVSAETVTIPGGIENPADKILKYAKDNNIDLIVMSTHGRGGIARWAVGSVTDNVSRHANCPVMTIPPSGCRIA